MAHTCTIPMDGGKSFDKVTNGDQIKSFVLSIAQDQ